MLGRLLVLLAFILVGACAYQPMTYGPKEGTRPEGYSELRVEDNVYRVRFETYREKDFEEVEQMALRRAAELTREKGFVEFEVLKKNHWMDTETEWVPETSTFQGGYTDYLGAINSAPAQAVPGYTRAYHIRYVELMVRLLNPA